MDNIDLESRFIFLEMIGILTLQKLDHQLIKRLQISFEIRDN